MPSHHKDCSSWLIEQLQTNMMAFNDNTSSLLQGQEKAFHLYHELLREDTESLLKRSKSTRSVRIRARDLLKRIFQSIGPEAFLLCTLGPTITKLGENAHHIRLSTIRNWWTSTVHPQGLVTLANDICKAYSISSWLVPCQKRGASEDPGASDYSVSKMQKTSVESSHSSTLPAAGVATQVELDKQTHTSQAQSAKADMLQNVPKIPSTDATLPDSHQQLVFENASLQGISTIFDRHMCSSIRQVAVDGELKAAITMVFPGWAGPVDCLMSLDICPQDVEQLAMALFHAKVKWVEHDLHIVLDKGMKLIIPDSEATLKGVLDDDIMKVFGLEVHHAITECAIRRRESTEGKNVTECVSMIFTTNGAIINLSLDL